MELLVNELLAVVLVVVLVVVRIFVGLNCTVLFEFGGCFKLYAVCDLFGCVLGKHSRSLFKFCFEWLDETEILNGGDLARGGDFAQQIGRCSYIVRKKWFWGTLTGCILCVCTYLSCWYRARAVYGGYCASWGRIGLEGFENVLFENAAGWIAECIPVADWSGE